MTRQLLPIIDTSRTEFGFHRTACDCDQCTISCRYIPGYLIPSDLDRITQQLDSHTDIFAWATEHLLASPGALVKHNGRMFRIPTLVPARRSDGACIFLTPDNRCSIHASAPFGCAFFDSHMSGDEADRRSSRGLRAIIAAWRNEELYAQVWAVLHLAGLRAPSPETCRQRMRQAQ